MRRHALGAGIAGIWLVYAATVIAQAPELASGVLLYDGSAPVTVGGGHATPTCADWDNDGLVDLVVGQYTQGKINLFVNQGSNRNPLFDGSTFLQGGGVDITTSYG